MKPIIIFGTGDIASLANFYFHNDTDSTVAAFTVDREYAQNSFEEKPVVPFDEISMRFPPSEFDMFIALSYRNLNKIREEKYYAAKKLGYHLVSYVSSKCTNLSPFPFGDNCFILEDNTIQPFVKIGNNVTLWSGNHIGHHSTIDDHNFISSHVVISGHCMIATNCFLGVNATLHNNVKISKNNIIGAGAIITKSTKDNEVYIPEKSVLLARKSGEINL
jgi:sugar O-acyltransferase (sialic acid O-acetyltransferase NeuD family)